MYKLHKTKIWIPKKINDMKQIYFYLNKIMNEIQNIYYIYKFINKDDNLCNQFSIYLMSLAYAS